MPSSPGNLPRLRHLDLRANRLSTLPATLANLKLLEKLDLRWNRFETMPDWLEQLEKNGCIVYT